MTLQMENVRDSSLFRAGMSIIHCREGVANKSKWVSGNVVFLDFKTSGLLQKLDSSSIVVLLINFSCSLFIACSIQ